MQVIALLTLLLSCEVVVVVGMEEVLANDGVGGGLVHAAATLATGGHRITAAAAVGATSTMVSAWKKYFKKNNGGETSDSDDDDVDMLDESGASVETLKEINQPCSCWTKLVGRGRYGFFSNTFKNNHRKFEKNLKVICSKTDTGGGKNSLFFHTKSPYSTKLNKIRTRFEQNIR